MKMVWGGVEERHSEGKFEVDRVDGATGWTKEKRSSQGNNKTKEKISTCSIFGLLLFVMVDLALVPRVCPFVLPNAPSTPCSPALPLHKPMGKQIYV